MSDGFHFTADGYRKIGRRYALQMLKLLGIDTEKATPVNTINAAGAEVANVEIFDIYGRAVANGYKGIAVVRITYTNGKVVTEKRLVN